MSNEKTTKVILQKINEVQQVGDCGVREDYGNDIAEGDYGRSTVEREQNYEQHNKSSYYVHRLQ